MSISSWYGSLLSCVIIVCDHSHFSFLLIWCCNSAEWPLSSNLPFQINWEYPLCTIFGLIIFRLYLERVRCQGNILLSRDSWPQIYWKDYLLIQWFWIYCEMRLCRQHILLWGISSPFPEKNIHGLVEDCLNSKFLSSLLNFTCQQWPAWRSP